MSSHFSVSDSLPNLYLIMSDVSFDEVAMGAADDDQVKNLKIIVKIILL